MVYQIQLMLIIQNPAINTHLCFELRPIVIYTSAIFPLPSYHLRLSFLICETRLSVATVEGVR